METRESLEPSMGPLEGASVETAGMPDPVGQAHGTSGGGRTRSASSGAGGQPETADRVAAAALTPAGGSAGGLAKKLLIPALVLGAAWLLLGRTADPARPVPYHGPEDKAPAYKKHLAAAATPLALTSADINKKLAEKVASAVKSKARILPDLPKNTPRKVIDGIAKGETQLYSLLFLDTCDEDGDFIRVTIDGGMAYGPFMITHAGTWIHVPITGSAVPSVTLEAVKDGQGGITVGVMSSTGFWYSSVLPEGATERVPIGF